jgi:hypothetical protein
MWLGIAAGFLEWLLGLFLGKKPPDLVELDAQAAGAEAQAEAQAPRTQAGIDKRLEDGTF